MGATARKATSLQRFLADTPPDFIIEVALDVWGRMDPNTRKALIDHELEHCKGGVNPNSKMFEADLRGHDFEDFSAILARRGLWTDGLKAAQTAMQGEIFDGQGEVIDAAARFGRSSR